MKKSNKKKIVAWVVFSLMLQLLAIPGLFMVKVEASETSEVIDFYIATETATQYFLVGDEAEPFLPDTMKAVVKTEVDDSDELTEHEYSYIDVPIVWKSKDNRVFTTAYESYGYPYTYIPSIDPTWSGHREYRIDENAKNILETKEIDCYVVPFVDSNTMFEISWQSTLPSGHSIVVDASDNKTSVIYEGDTKIGTVQIDKISASFREIIVVTTIPEAGYRYKEGSIKANETNSTNSSVVSRTGRNSFYFVMGASPIKVIADFEKIPSNDTAARTLYVEYVKNIGSDQNSYEDAFVEFSVGTEISIDNNGGIGTYLDGGIVTSVPDDEVEMFFDLEINNPKREGYLFNGYIFEADSKTFIAQWIVKTPDEPVTPETPGGTVTPETPEGTLTPETPGGTLTPETPGGTLTPETSGGTLTPETSGGTLTPETSGGTLTPETSGGTLTPETSEGTLTPEASEGTLTPETSVGTKVPEVIIEAIRPGEVPKSVKVDGDQLDKSEYSIDENQNISIHAEYIENLSDGEHTVTVSYDDAVYEAVMLVDEGVPLSMSEFIKVAGTWSLFDLIMTIVSIAVAVGYLIIRPKETIDEYEKEEPEEKQRKRFFISIILIVTACLNIALLLLTQNFAQPMTVFDMYSVAFTIIAAVQVALILLVIRKRQIDKEETYTA